jgi:Transposase DDE domain
LLLQDVVETTGEDGEPDAAIQEGTASGRIPSATDPQMRHGRKSKTKRFNGHKASIAADLESQIIVDGDVLAGDAPDAQGLLEQVERAEENTGQSVEQTIGDCAYGGGPTRQTFAEAGRELVAKVPQEASNKGFFRKSAFELDLIHDTVTCPGGKTATKFTTGSDGGKQFHFGMQCRGCDLRAQCTSAAGGRQVQVHPQEALLQAARDLQQTPEGRALLRQRVMVEHRLARLAQLGIGQARYVGRRKVRFQLLIAATLANLRRVWNWERIQPDPTQNGSQECGDALGSALAWVLATLATVIEHLMHRRVRLAPPCGRQISRPQAAPALFWLARRPAFRPHF